MTDQTPDFDSMSPEEIMAWMEALAVRQGAVEGIINDVSNVQIAEIDPNTVDIADEYIPYGMDPDVWAKKKAIEDATKAERLAVMKAEKDAKAASSSDAPVSKPVPAPILPITRQPQPEPEPASLDFMSDLVGGGDESSDLLAAISASAPMPTPQPDADDFGGMDFLSNLGQSASDDMGDFGSFDFSGLDALGMDEPVAAGGASMDWLESIVSDSKPVQTVSDVSTNEMSEAMLPDTLGDSLSETAVGRILDDPMDWLSDFAEDKPMLATSAPTPDLDALFASQADTSPTMDAETNEIRSALKQGNAQPDDVKAWMDSMLDKGLSRTDVKDEDLDDDSKPLEGEIPDWLVSQVGAPPDLSAQAESTLEGEADLPDWLTAPVSEEQTAEFEAIFTEAAQDIPPIIQPSVLDNSPSLGLLDTSAIQVEMNDPWVEAFELERSERMGETDQLADWYNTAQADLRVSTDAIETINSRDLDRTGTRASITLQPADLKPEADLPAGEAQAVPVWLGGDQTPSAGGSAESDGIPAWLQTDTLGQPEAVGDDEDLPDWLKPQVEQSLAAEQDTPMPDWLNKRVVTDEFAAMTVSPVSSSNPPTPAYPPAEKPRRSLPAATISPSEIAQLLNSARGSLKMGDVGAMVEKYDVLVHAHAALDEVSADLAVVSRDPAHKGNPAVLRVYGDALMRQGKLQAALDTYRAALNLL